MPQSQSRTVRVLHRLYVVQRETDKGEVRHTVRNCRVDNLERTPWVMEMEASSVEVPAQLVKTLTSVILDSGGWMLSRGASDTGRVNMLFEFERQACVDIYSALVEAGVELGQSDHVRLTELCNCTFGHQEDCATEIASIDLNIQTCSIETRACSPAELFT